MESEPFHQALRHLEDAVARLERVARAAAPDARLAALEERHRRLREGATAALERLDRLIGSAASPSPPPQDVA
jgi:hypothetical protein